MGLWKSDIIYYKLLLSELKQTDQSLPIINHQPAAQALYWFITQNACKALFYQTSDLQTIFEGQMHAFTENQVEKRSNVRKRLLDLLSSYIKSEKAVSIMDKHSAPAFSIASTSHKPQKAPNHFVPGPGAYETNSTLQISKHHITKHTEQRFKEHIPEVPGPGAYNYSSTNQHAPSALVLSRTKQHVPSSQVVPGPGAYQPNFKKVVKVESGYKIGNSSKIADFVGEAKKLPGPGNYETNKSTIIKQHAIKIGTEKRAEMVLKTFTPGPGQYQDKNIQEISLRSNPRTVFGKSGRSLSTSNLVPGPGSYSIPDKFQQTINKSKGFSIASKVPELPTFASKVPGPGAYNNNELETLKNKTSSYSIGKAQRLKLQNEKQILQLPGPQKYTISRGAFEHRSVAFGKEKRSSPSKDAELIPGPGAYESRLQSHMPQFSVPKSNASWIKGSLTPGPGSYEPKINDINNYNSIKIKQDERKPFYDEKKWVPGPGAYTSNQITNKSIGFKIGTQKRGDNKAPNGPGPGEYTIPSTVSNIPKYSR